jgi:hypothetical protein
MKFDAQVYKWSSMCNKMGVDPFPPFSLHVKTQWYQTNSLSILFCVIFLIFYLYFMFYLYQAHRAFLVFQVCRWHVKCLLVVKQKTKNWYLSNGYSKHITRDRQYFKFDPARDISNIVSVPQLIVKIDIIAKVGVRFLFSPLLHT